MEYGSKARCYRRENEQFYYCRGSLSLPSVVVLILLLEQVVGLLPTRLYGVLLFMVLLI